ncbi:MAG: MFS transporter, partial [Promethearchaeota archaeon]
MSQNEIERKHSRRNMASYGSGSLAREFLSMAFTTTVFFYYEDQVGLNGWLVVTGIIIFAIYNMFNDPIIGYLTNRPFKFTKNWGRRFPWLIFGGIPFGISYFLVFVPPSVDPVSGQWIIFIWLVFTACLFDTFHSLYFVNFIALFPEKYRTNKERRSASGIYVPIGVVGVALGAIIPPILFDFGNLPSFAFQGLMVFLIAMFFLLLAIPGLRDDKRGVEEYLISYEQAPQRESFFKTFKTAIKQRSFIVWMFLYTMYFSLVNTM